MKKITSRLVETTERHTLTLDHNDIARLLAAGAGVEIPAGARMYVSVPGGGDWSNTALELNEYPVEIEWTIKTMEDDDGR